MKKILVIAPHPDDEILGAGGMIIKNINKGNDVYVNVSIPYTTAVLGGEAIVPTLTGKVSCKIAAGTQPGSKIRLRNKGIPFMKNPDHKGDEYVVIQIEVPKNLTPEERQSLMEYDRVCRGHKHGGSAA